ncbi:MAG: signal recognition particle-docking protein FtsY, partial [Nitrospiraceae bacterium]
NLMDELRKIKRVLGRELPGAPHEVLLVLDASVGQNALAQARQFHDAIGVTGIALTKLDGTARGGIVVAIAEELKIPVRLIGVGEDPEDLQDFRVEEFVDALFEQT